VHRRDEHLTAPILERLLDGDLPASDADLAGAHLRECERCAAEYEATRALFAALGGLPGFEPSPAFAEAVLERVLPAMASDPIPAWRVRLTPRTWRGWSLLLAVAFAPALPLIGVMYWLIRHPLLSPATLWEWVAFRTLNLAQAGVAGLVQYSLSWVPLDAFDAALTAIGSVPVAAIGGAAGLLALAIPFSAWSLMRLTRSPRERANHAN